MISELPFPAAGAVPVAALQRLPLRLYRHAGIEVSLLRLDALHPQISGNKAFKLRYHLQRAVAQGYRRVLSFGGAYSNHLHALAFAGRALGLETVGVVRGEPAYAANPTLSDAVCWGMRLHFVDRQAYRQRQQVAFEARLRREFGDFYPVPEGGGGPPGLRGCREILDCLAPEVRAGISLLGLPVGTGTTLAGLVAARPAQCELVGFPVLRGGEFLYRDIRRLLAGSGIADPGGWRLQLDAHEGGYGRVSAQLAAFMAQLEQEAGVVLDPVYTGKMLLGFNRLVAAGRVPCGTRAVLIHTGGLQGLRGLAKTLYDRRTRFRGVLPL